MTVKTFTHTAFLSAGIALLSAQPPTSPPSGQKPATGIADPVTNGAPPSQPPRQYAAATGADEKFVKEALTGGMTEVELGKLASQKGKSDAVKQFGQTMVDDHTKAGNDLRQLAGNKSIAIPSALDSKHKARVAKLSKLSGDSFDKAYIKDQLADHQEDVTKFQQEASNGADPAVKEFATKTLPTLQQHLKMITGLNGGTESGR